MEATDYIPREYFNLWYELFKKSSGRLLCNPSGDELIYIRYKFDDMDSYTTLQTEFLRLTTPIVETKPSFFKTLKKRLGLKCKIIYKCFSCTLVGMWLY